MGVKNNRLHVWSTSKGKKSKPKPPRELAFYFPPHCRGFDHVALPHFSEIKIKKKKRNLKLIENVRCQFHKHNF